MFIGMQKHPALNSVKLHYILPNKKNTSKQNSYIIWPNILRWNFTQSKPRNDANGKSNR